jgi:hypothetical protein
MIAASLKKMLSSTPSFVLYTSKTIAHKQIFAMAYTAYMTLFKVNKKPE